MRILIDENFPSEIGERLASKGYNVKFINGRNKGISDNKVFELAKGINNKYIYYYNKKKKLYIKTKVFSKKGKFKHFTPHAFK